MIFFIFFQPFIIKSEPIFAYHISESESFETVNLPTEPNYDMGQEYEVEQEEEGGYEADSLLVATLELPSSAHGLDAPMYQENKSTDEVNLTTCRICDRECSSLYNRVRHEKSCHLMCLAAPFFCGYCEIVFPGEDELVTHLREKHSEVVDPVKDNFHPKNITDIKPIVKEHLVESKNFFIEFLKNLRLIRKKPGLAKKISVTSYVNFNKTVIKMIETSFCKCCNRQFSRPKALVNHLRKTKQAVQFTCYFCCISFPNRSQFAKHSAKKTCKSRARLIQCGDILANLHYKCCFCKDIFVRKILLTTHISSHFSNPPPESCFKCSNSLETVEDYREHMRGPCSYNIYCSICEISLPTIEEFSVHSRQMHSEEAAEMNFPFELEGDFRSVVNNDSLKRTRPLRRKKHRCKYCGELFRQLKLLTTHIKKTHLSQTKNNFTYAEESDSNNYSCSQCGSLFSNLESWCEHQKTHSANNVHHCSECSRVFSSISDLEQHKSMHSNIKLKLYRCSDSSYKTVSDFTNSPSFSCLKCQKAFNYEDELQNHVAEHDNDDDGQSNVSKRPRRSVSETSKVKNMYREEPEEPLEAPQFACQICNKSFYSERGVKNHSYIHAQRKNVQKLECQVCSETFTNIEFLLDHLKCHSTKKISDMLFLKPIANSSDATVEAPIPTPTVRFSCTFCKAFFYTARKLELHTRTLHKEKRGSNFKCPSCPKQFMSKASLVVHIKQKRHLKLVTNYVPAPVSRATFQCHICKKVMRSKGALTKHFKVHSKPGIKPVIVNVPVKKFKCSVCQKSVYSKAAFTKHMKTHPENFCNICNKAFLTKSALTAHVGWHQRKPSFKCNYCPKTFVFPKSMHSHVRLCHSNKIEGKPRKIATKNNVKLKTKVWTQVTDIPAERLYKCTLCNTTFDKSGKLRQHILAVHIDNSV